MSDQPEYPPSFSGVVALLHRLREPDGCPWDREQTPRSLLPYLLEEAHEAADAIEAEDDEAAVDELGDLLLHLAYQIALAEEDDRFTADDVARRIIEKMIRRHPHVFGDAEYAGEAHQAMWERLKRGEEKHVERGVLGDIPAGLPALVRAYRIQQKVASVGFDWETPEGARAKIFEEIEEIDEVVGSAHGEMEAEYGDLLFAVVNWGRRLGLHPHIALAAANRKFERRFECLEELAGERGISLEEASIDALEELWTEVKTAEGGGDTD